MYYIARFAVVGGILGSMQHLFYWSLDKRYPARDMLTIAKKILIDQTVCTPINIIVFIYGLGILENKTFAQINEEFKEKSLFIFSVSCVNKVLWSVAVAYIENILRKGTICRKWLT